MDAVPQRRMRLLERLERERYVFEAKQLAFETERLRAQAGQHQRKAFLINLLRIALLVVARLDRGCAAAKAEIEPPIADLIQHADFLDQTQRMVERQRVDQRAEAEPSRTLRDRREIDARRRRHAERREMVLGDVVAVEAGALIGLDDFEASFVILVELHVAMVEVIKDADLH